MSRFWAVWFAGFALELGGGIVLALTLVASVLVIQFRDNLTPDGVPIDQFSVIVHALAGMGIQQIVIGGIGLAISLFVVGQILGILLSLEKNSRLTREILSAELRKLIAEEVARREGL